MTNSSTVARVGAQRPTHLLTPDGDFDFTDGDVAIELAASLGLHLLDWQCWLVRWILAVDENGIPACNTVILVVPRQCGKGAILEALELFWLIVAGIPTVIHTAHEADTAAGHMERIESLTADPDIDLPKLHTYKANGKERTKNLDDKLVLQYRTRTKATKRGASPQRVVLDESQELQDAHLAALVPAMAAQSMSPDKLPQLIYTGSAPLAHSEYMHRLLDKVIRTRPAKTLLAMWACEPDDDPEDVDNWYKSNPSLGILISEEWVRDTEFLVMSPSDFAAERLGIPVKPVDKSAGHGLIDLDVWTALARVNVEYDHSTVSLACVVAYDRSWTSIVAVGLAPDGFEQAKLVATRPGTQWAAERVRELCQELGGKPVAMVKDEPLIDDMIALGVTVVPVSGADQAKSSQKLIDACSGEAPTLRHRGEPALTKALELAATKPYGDGNTDFSSRASNGDISPLKALSLAYGRLGAEQALGDPLAAILA